MPSLSGERTSQGPILPILGRLLCYGRDRRPAILIAGLSAAAVAGLTVTVPVVQRIIIDEVIVGGRRPLAPLIVLLGGAAVLISVALYLRHWMAGWIGYGIQENLRRDVVRAVVRLDGAGHDRVRPGQVIGRTTSDLTEVRELVEQLPSAFGNAVLFLSSLVVMFTMSPTLTLVALAVVPAMWCASRAAYRRIPPATQAAQHLEAELTDFVENAIVGVRVVKGFAQEERLARVVEHRGAVALSARMRVQRLVAWFNPLIGSISALGQVGVLALGGFLAVRGTISLGTFLAFVVFLALLMHLARALAGLITNVQQSSVSVNRIFELLDSAPEVADRPAAASDLPRGKPLRVSFEHVSFGYRDRDPVLTQLTLDLRAGETVVVVGASGSGKSTLAALLVRLYDPHSGTVRLGGRDVRDLTLDSVRTAVGVVSQDGFLFHGTIRANIARGDPSASDEQIAEAARVAEVAAFIEDLPNGYETVVGEGGVTLSGGQRQRIALARVLLADPDVIVLDNVLAAVDVKTGAAIVRGLRERLSGRCTTVIMAQSLEDQWLADRAVVLESGTVVDADARPELAESPSHGATTTPVEADEAAEPITTSLATAASANGGGPSAATPGSPLQLRRFAPGMALGLLLTILTSMGMLALPLVLREGIDSGVTSHDLAAIGDAAVLGLMVVVSVFWFMTGATWVNGAIAERLLYSLYVRTFRHLQRLGLGYYEREGSGSIITTVTVDVPTLRNFFKTELPDGLSNLLWVLSIGVMLVFVDTRMGMVLLGVQPLLIAALFVFRGASAGPYRTARLGLNAINAAVHEAIRGLRVNQLLRQQARTEQHISDLGQQFLAARMRAQRMAAAYLAFGQLCSVATLAVVLGAGALWVRADLMTVGTLIAFVLYVDMYLGPVQGLAQLADGYQQAKVSLDRLRRLLDTPPSPVPAAEPVRLPRRLRGRLVLDRVQFRYPGSSQMIIHDVCLTIEPGQTVALVGQTGAGKSTLVKLLARFYDATSGTVSVDGIDVRDMDPIEYRRHLGVVPQEPYLFSGSVLENIAFGRHDANRAAVELAARKVGADRMIETLPGGYLHRLTDGGRNLAVGQRQLLALARAELVNPDILLMDEATSALEPALERSVRIAMGRLARPRTTVLVAHRLALSAGADIVAVVHDGRIVEVGQPALLRAGNGPYAQMWRAAEELSPVDR